MQCAKPGSLNPERTCRRLWATEAGLQGMAAAIDRARSQPLQRPAPEIVQRGRLDKLVGAGAVHQGVVLDADPLPPTDLDDIGRAAAVRPRAAVIVLDRVTDPHNIGAILRSAAAFGALALIVTDRHTPEVTGTLAKSASGAVEHVAMVRVRNPGPGVGTAQGIRIPLHRPGRGGRPRPPGRHRRRRPDRHRPGGGGPRAATPDPGHLRRPFPPPRLPTGGPIGSLNVSNAAAGRALRTGAWPVRLTVRAFDHPVVQDHVHPMRPGSGSCAMV